MSARRARQLAIQEHFDTGRANLDTAEQLMSNARARLEESKEHQNYTFSKIADGLKVHLKVSGRHNVYNAMKV